MPTSVAIAIASSWAAETIAAAVITDAMISSAAWITYAGIESAIGFTISAGLRMAVASGAEDSPTASPAFTAQAEQRTHVIRSSIANRKTIYGRAMVSGPLLFAASSADNNTLHLVLALAGHEIDAVESVYFNDELSTDAKFSGYQTVAAHLGAADQVADADLVAAGLGWTAAHRLQGVAYLYVKLTYSRDVFPRGIPNIKAVVRGKKLYDPRTATTVWSQNLALAVRDYLAGSYGLSSTAAEIDDTALIAAANLCDEIVDITAQMADVTYAKTVVNSGASGEASAAVMNMFAAMPMPALFAAVAAQAIADVAGSIQAQIDAAKTEIVAHGGAVAEARYTVNAVLDTGSTPRSNMESLLSGCGGALTWPAGLWTLHVGAYESPSVTLDEDDLAGPLQIRARVPRQDLYNAIKGTFVDPTQGWQPTDFPAITNSTYATQDGATIFRDVAFPVTTSSATAQRLAKMIVEKSRQGITVQASFKLSAFKLATWENVMLSIASMGWSSKVFKVTGWSFNESGNINLTLQEEAAACYTWIAEETIADPAPDTNLPAWDTTVAPGTPEVAESLFETTGSAGVKARASMSWAAAADGLVVDYLPEYRPAGGAWVVLPASAALAIDINDIAPGQYEFRVRARNALGVRSAYSGTRAKEILGLTAAPSAVSGFAVIKSGGFALASWVLTTDLDVRIGGRIVIRHSPLTTGAAWENGIIVEEFNGDAVTGSVPLMTGTYLAKALDSTGNYSTTAASFVATEGMVTGWTTVATTTQQTAFTGSKTNTAVVGAALQLDSASTIDSMATAIDAWTYLDALGGISGTGSYAFDTYVDLTTVATRRFEADIAATSFDAADLIDSKTDLIDDWAPLDGASINDCDVTLYAATTPDDPAGSPTWSAWMPFFVADFTCRAAKFKLDLASGSATHNISVSTLAVDIKVPA